MPPSSDASLDLISSSLFHLQDNLGDLHKLVSYLEDVSDQLLTANLIALIPYVDADAQAAIVAMVRERVEI